MAVESTARDALVAELLGDVGRLHDEVSRLKEVLPNEAQAFELRIAGLIALLNQAGDVYKVQIQTYTNGQAERLKAQTDAAVSDARSHVVQEVDAALTDSFARFGQAVKQTVQTEMAAPLEAMRRSQRRGTLWFALASAGGGLLAGLVVLLAGAQPTDLSQENYLGLGKATAAAWVRLDGRAKATINAERIP